MTLLIDGYNLLNCAGITVTDGTRYSLEASRLAIAKFLRSVLTPHDLGMTTIVFDGREAPKGLPQRIRLLGIDVQFSKRGEEADDLLERIIRAHHSPRQLTVVSSDHRVQRAAKRRRARAVDSEVWFAEIVAARKPVSPSPQEKPLADEELLDVEAWVERCEVVLREPTPEPRDATTPGDDAAIEAQRESSPEGVFENFFSEDYLRSLQREIDGDSRS